jgi:hypothetical protein
MTDHDLGIASCSRERGPTWGLLLDLSGVVPVVPNGDFETGDTSGWSLTGSGTHTEVVDGTAKRSGSYGLHVTAEADSVSQQSVTLGMVRPGQALGGFIKCVQEDPGALYLMMIYDGVTWVDYTVVDVSTPGDFVEYGYLATQYFENMIVQLFLQTDSATVEVYLDDFTISGGECITARGRDPTSTPDTIERTLPVGSEDRTRDARSLPPIFVLSSLNDYQVGAEGIAVKKKVGDALWQLRASIVGTNTPEHFRHLIVEMDDHIPVTHTVFYGFIPGDLKRARTAKRTATFTGYDYGWYLTRQRGFWRHLMPWVGFAGVDYPEVSEDTNPGELLRRLLGGNPLGTSWLVETGIEPHVITDVADWGTTTPKRMFRVDEKTPLLQTIQDIADHCGYIFEVKWLASGGMFHPVAYFIPYSAIDTDLDLPGPQTIDHEDGFDLEINVTGHSDERVNEVRVAGMTVDGGTGVYVVATAQSAARAAGDELAIQYCVNRPDLETSGECLAVAEAILAILEDPAAVYTVALHSRADLVLYQQIKFTGFPEIPEEWMRITGIEYALKKSEGEAQVTVTVDCVKDNNFSSSALLKMLTQDRTSEMKAVARSIVREMVLENLTGTIVGTPDEEATVMLDKDGRTIIARNLNPP